MNCFTDLVVFKSSDLQNWFCSFYLHTWQQDQIKLISEAMFVFYLNSSVCNIVIYYVQYIFFAMLLLNWMLHTVYCREISEENSSVADIAGTKPDRSKVH